MTELVASELCEIVATRVVELRKLAIGARRLARRPAVIAGQESWFSLPSRMMIGAQYIGKMRESRPWPSPLQAGKPISKSLNLIRSDAL